MQYLLLEIRDQFRSSIRTLCVQDLYQRNDVCSPSQFTAGSNWPGLSYSMRKAVPHTKKPQLEVEEKMVQIKNFTSCVMQLILIPKCVFTPKFRQN